MTRIDFWLGVLVFAVLVRAMFWEHRRADRKQHDETLIGIRGAKAIGSSALTETAGLRSRVDKLEAWRETLEKRGDVQRRKEDR